MFKTTEEALALLEKSESYDEKEKYQKFLNFREKASGASVYLYIRTLENIAQHRVPSRNLFAATWVETVEILDEKLNTVEKLSIDRAEARRHVSSFEKTNDLLTIELVQRGGTSAVLGNDRIITSSSRIGQADNKGSDQTLHAVSCRCFRCMISYAQTLSK